MSLILRFLVPWASLHHAVASLLWSVLSVAGHSVVSGETDLLDCHTSLGHTREGCLVRYLNPLRLVAPLLSPLIQEYCFFCCWTISSPSAWNYLSWNVLICGLTLNLFWNRIGYIKTRIPKRDGSKFDLHLKWNKLKLDLNSDTGWAHFSSAHPSSTPLILCLLQ